MLKQKNYRNFPIPMNGMKAIKRIQLKHFAHVNGTLVPIENKDLPFVIARVFYVYGLRKGYIRGGHAHLKCHQLLICLQGECRVICKNKKNKKVFKLNDPKEGLYIPPLTWARQKFTKDHSLLLVLADRKFEERDYIRKYRKFLKLI